MLRYFSNNFDYYCYLVYNANILLLKNSDIQKCCWIKNSGFLQGKFNHFPVTVKIMNRISHILVEHCNYYCTVARRQALKWSEPYVWMTFERIRTIWSHIIDVRKFLLWEVIFSNKNTPIFNLIRTKFHYRSLVI